MIVQEDHRAPVVMTQLWYKVGSSDEMAGKTGLSHALEHMMFKGTKTVPAGEYVKRISALGGSNNAYTTTEETVYHVTIAAQHLPKVLELEADRMANLNFSDTVFNNEMKVIREERRQRIDDNPDSMLYAELLNTAWTKSPNRTSVIGKMADLHKLKPNDLRQWYRRWYAPNNAVLVVVGDVQPENVFAQVEQYFGSLKERKLADHQDISEPETHEKSSFATLKGNTKQPMMMLAYRVPHLQKMDEKLPYALDMLTNVLDGHSAARLSQRLVRGSQVAQNIGTGYSLLARQSQMWIISVSPTNGVDLAQLKAVLKKEIADVAHNGVSEAELNRAKTIQRTNKIYSYDEISARANLMGTLESVGLKYDDENAIRQRLDEVTTADIQAATKLLTQEREVYVELLPK
ncbi:M16 family metallopeptidase [Kingella negevensis]|uniref:M16 family metallopeptidase n=1 Tax=Kingella negevensis TaxID=1522312 RepID=UPI00254B7AB7|nr:pitrilysin family protein [Kingella negevensis]MDK4679350.1 pitrilysin family protein [Kingella negevensis]MDK4682930.1 pitrilysin family protein [Kingella negevensis]MDK4691129.1 pitrilysin family protein [Kingella negevensis]